MKIKSNSTNSFNKYEWNKCKKHSIILDANTVIKPDTVMVKFSSTSIALSTVLSKLKHIGIANVTEKFIAVLVKIDFF